MTATQTLLLTVGICLFVISSKSRGTLYVSLVPAYEVVYRALAALPLFLLRSSSLKIVKIQQSREGICKNRRATSFPGRLESNSLSCIVTPGLRGRPSLSRIRSPEIGDFVLLNQDLPDGRSCCCMPRLNLE
jgi:hypothetical protein